MAMTHERECLHLNPHHSHSGIQSSDFLALGASLRLRPRKTFLKGPALALVLRPDRAVQNWHNQQIILNCLSPDMTSSTPINSIFELKNLSLSDPAYQYVEDKCKAPSPQRSTWPTFDPTLISLGVAESRSLDISSSSSSATSSISNSSSTSRTSSINDTPTDLAPMPPQVDSDSIPAPSQPHQRRVRMRSPPPPISSEDLDELMEEDGEDEEDVPLFQALPMIKRKPGGSRFNKKLNYGGLFKRNANRRYDERYALPTIHSENEMTVLRARRQEQIRAYKARNQSESRPKRRAMRDGRNSQRANLIWSSQSSQSSQSSYESTILTPDDAADEDEDDNARTRRVHFAI